MVSRLSQHAFSTHPRPIHDPSFHFQAPGGYVEVYNTWDSFHSDHVAVLGGLVAVIYIARSRFAIFAIVWTALVETSRTYTGAHYPSDLIGGAALGAMVVWVAQASWPISLGGRVMRWEQSSPSLFYMSAFFLTYQITTLFGDIRFTFSPLIRHMLSFSF
jgi:undecaprenyl-diphosphatase